MRRGVGLVYLKVGLGRGRVTLPDQTTTEPPVQSERHSTPQGVEVADEGRPLPPGVTATPVVQLASRPTMQRKATALGTG